MSTSIPQEKWQNHLDTQLLVKDTDESNTFLAWCLANHAHENVLFFWAVDEFRNIAGSIDEDARLRMAQALCKTFIVCGSHCEANIDNQTRGGILKAINENSTFAEVEVFDKAQKQIYSLIQTDCLTRFMLAREEFKRELEIKKLKEEQALNRSSSKKKSRRTTSMTDSRKFITVNDVDHTHNKTLNNSNTDLTSTSKNERRKSGANSSQTSLKRFGTLKRRSAKKKEDENCNKDEGSDPITSCASATSGCEDNSTNPAKPSRRTTITDTYDIANLDSDGSASYNKSLASTTKRSNSARTSKPRRYGTLKGKRKEASQTTTDIASTPNNNEEDPDSENGSNHSDMKHRGSNSSIHSTNSFTSRSSGSKRVLDTLRRKRSVPKNFTVDDLVPRIPMVDSSYIGVSEHQFSSEHKLIDIAGSHRVQRNSMGSAPSRNASFSLKDKTIGDTETDKTANVVSVKSSADSFLADHDDDDDDLTKIDFLKLSSDSINLFGGLSCFDESTLSDSSILPSPSMSLASIPFSSTAPVTSSTTFSTTNAKSVTVDSASPTTSTSTLSTASLSTTEVKASDSSTGVTVAAVSEISTPTSSSSLESVPKRRPPLPPSYNPRAKKDGPPEITPVYKGRNSVSRQDKPAMLRSLSASNIKAKPGIAEENEYDIEILSKNINSEKNLSPTVNAQSSHSTLASVTSTDSMEKTPSNSISASTSHALPSSSSSSLNISRKNKKQNSNDKIGTSKLPSSGTESKPKTRKRVKKNIKFRTLTSRTKTSTMV